MAFRSVAGHSRRSQAALTNGAGAIVDFPSGSYMPLGLDWQSRNLPVHALEDLKVYEPRLQKLLGVSFFRLAPAPGEREISDFGKKIREEWALPAVRFPEWLQCPQCNRIGRTDDPFEMQPNLAVRCTACKKNVSPIRFVIGCRKGHIEDFPWEYWAHSESKSASGCQRPLLKLEALGKSASLGDLFVKCYACGSQRSLSDIFVPQALTAVRCNGNRPWLLDREKCGQPVVTLQRGASNIYFPLSASMLSIPPASEAIARILERRWDLFRYIPAEALEPALKGFLDEHHPNTDFRQALDWLQRRRGIEEKRDPEDERGARRQEYEAMSQECISGEEDHQSSEFENRTYEPAPSMSPWFDLVAAVSRLREVRVTCGFSRIDPVAVSIEKIQTARTSGQLSPLGRRPANWLPAVEVRGEGIFFRFREDRMQTWEKSEHVVERAGSINAAYESYCAGKGFEPPHIITPRLLLVHSFAHAIIRRFSLDCGYSSASLRERLYIAEPDAGASMAGCLIYTGCTDSDGSLGGLVNLATPERLEQVIVGAIRDAAWCGNDPVCGETDPSASAERLSGACCHSCLLLPETACEKFNKELDRTMLVGGQGVKGEQIEGYFGGMIEKIENGGDV
jgi:hypothetical protein